MAGIGGYNGWRWIFIVEGLTTVLLAGVSKWLVVDWPEQAKFLSPEEREQLLQRLQEDLGEAKMSRLDKQALRRTFADWKIWVG